VINDTKHANLFSTGGYSGGGGAAGVVGGGQMGNINNQQFSSPGAPPPPQQYKPPGPTPLVPSQAVGPSGTAIQTQQVTIPNQVSNPNCMAHKIVQLCC